jgi:hypothetical protein
MNLKLEILCFAGLFISHLLKMYDFGYFLFGYTVCHYEDSLLILAIEIPLVILIFILAIIKLKELWKGTSLKHR